MEKYDNNTKSILSIEENEKVLLSVNGNTDIYKPYQDNNGLWDLQVVYRENAVYGLSCENFDELKHMLVEDCKNGIITIVCV